MPRGAQYATAVDGTRIAFVTAGSGRPLFWLPHFLASHVELEWEFPQRYIYATLSKRCQVIRFDGRGLGLSDREVTDLSPEARMRDLDAVAGRLGIDNFDLVGVQGGGNLAVAYAAAHPGRVNRLVLLNWAANFSEEEANTERMQAVATLMERDWDMLTENIGGVSFGYNSPFAAGYGRLVRASVSQQMAIRYGTQIASERCLDLLEQIRAETLVLHSERSSYASASSARATSARVPNSRLRAFEGDLPDHIEKVVSAIADFIAPLPADAASPGTAPASPPTPRETPRPQAHAFPARLTAREVEVLRLVARGLSNREMAAELFLSPRTVERHLENVYRKTGTRNRTQVTAFAVAQGLFQPD